MAKRPPGARIFDFNDERSDLIAEVARRVMQEATGGADRGGLEFLLNDAVYHEVRRHEDKRSRRGRRTLAHWLGVRHQLPRRDRHWIEGQVRRLVRHHVRDIAGNFDPRVYSFASSVLPVLLAGVLNAASLDHRLKMFRGLRERATVDGELDTIRALATRSTMVLVPTHSSNLDSLVVGWALVDQGLPPMTYGAGKNLFSNPLVSYFMHNLGAYRLDRRLRYSLYKDTLKTYSQVLLERGYHSLFFPGGTRSRSNAIESRLKLGLLGSAFAAQVGRLRQGKRDAPIVIVPATINYALVLEAETLIAEHLKREGQQRFIIEDDEFSRVGRISSFFLGLLRTDSRVHLHFGQPIDLLGNAVAADGISRDPRGRPVDISSYFRIGGELAVDRVRDVEYTRLLGGRLVEIYHRDNVILPTQIVARALYRRVRARFAGEEIYRFLRRDGTISISREQLLQDVEAIRGVLRERRNRNEIRLGQATDHGSVEEVLERALATFRVYHSRPVVRLDADRVIAGDLKLLLFYQNRLEGYRLDDELGPVAGVDAGVVVSARQNEDLPAEVLRMSRRLRRIATSDEAELPIGWGRKNDESGAPEELPSRARPPESVGASGAPAPGPSPGESGSGKIGDGGDSSGGAP